MCPSVGLSRPFRGSQRAPRWPSQLGEFIRGGVERQHDLRVDQYDIGDRARSLQGAKVVDIRDGKRWQATIPLRKDM